jgi:hypothetical protein
MRKLSCKGELSRVFLGILNVASLVLGCVIIYYGVTKKISGTTAGLCLWSNRGEPLPVNDAESFAYM